MAFERINILGVNIDSLTMQQAVEKCEDLISERIPSMVATANAEMIMRATKDSELRSILNRSALVVPDGAGTVWAAHHLGCKMPERVAGYDLAQEILKLAPSKNQRIYFFGGAPEVAEKARLKAESIYPGIQIVGTRNGFFKPEDESQIVSEIRKSRSDVLFVALGVPKQEKFIAHHLKQLKVPLCIGVGGTFDVMAGVMKRAPEWMQKAKLEWLFRGMMQPTRAGRLMALPKFVWKVYTQPKN